MNAIAALPSPVLLFLSLAALLFGPALFTLAKTRANFLKSLDGFVLVVISGLVLLHILPHTVMEIGWIALVIVLAGLLLPTAAERFKTRLAGTAHALSLVFAMLGIGLHAFTDGMALSDLLPAHGYHGTMLPTAVILHRIPDGLTVWWLIRPAYGRAPAVRTLIIMAVATVLGYFAGDTVFAYFSHAGVGVFEAIMAGSLLHVIFHHHHPMRHDLKEKDRWQWAAGVGALAGMLLITLLSHTTIPSSGGLFTEFLTTILLLARTSAPALVFAYALAGLIQTFLPHAGYEWLKTGSLPLQSAKGMIFGLPLPICSCGVIPVYRSLIASKVPLAAAIAFFVATPELGIDSVLISLPLLGWQYTVLRLIFAAALALLIGMFMGKMGGASRTTAMQQGDTAEIPESSFHGWRDGLKRALHLGFIESADDTLPWIALGLVIAALCAPMLNASTFIGWHPDLQVVALAFLGMPMYVCASGATPLAAVLVHNGIAPGAALAFLLTGPATNATTFAVLARYHGKRLAGIFAVGMTVLAIGSGIIFNRIYNTSLLPDLQQARTEAVTGLQNVSLAVLLGLLAFSLLRRGPRAIINEIVSFDDGDHDHAHEDAEEKDSCCHHEH